MHKQSILTVIFCAYLAAAMDGSGFVVIGEAARSRYPAAVR